MTRPGASSTRPLLTFFLITFGISWTCFIAVRSLLYVGVFAPAIVAISLTVLADGSAGLRALLRPLFHWRVGGRWFLFAVSYMAVIKLTVALVHRAVMGAWPRFGHESWYIIVAATVVSTVIGGQAGEEIGWRGYALPRLADRLGYPRASLLLGLIWACWHLPLFFMAGADTYGQSFLVYAVQVTALSVAISWLYLRTGGSLLLTMLMHSAINQSKDIVPSIVPGATNVFTGKASIVAWMTATLLWVCAAYFLYRMRGIRSASIWRPDARADKASLQTENGMRRIWRPNARL